MAIPLCRTELSKRWMYLISRRSVQHHARFRAYEPTCLVLEHLPANHIIRIRRLADESQSRTALAAASPRFRNTPRSCLLPLSNETPGCQTARDVAYGSTTARAFVLDHDTLPTSRFLACCCPISSTRCRSSREVRNKSSSVALAGPGYELPRGMCRCP
jgi:hypothetical protein